MLKSYLAGFFDGEGCVSVYKNGQQTSYCLRVQLTQNKNEESTYIFNYLKTTFGGSLVLRDRKNCRPTYHWQLSGDKAVLFLMYLLPYLTIKFKQAKVAINWHNQRPKERVRKKNGQVAKYHPSVFKNDEKVYLQLKEMKKL